jgi:hypothetical protein
MMFGAGRSFRALVDANPVSVAAASAFADRVQMDEIVFHRIAWQTPADGRGQARSELRFVSRRLGRPIMVLVGATVVAVALAASPAFGFLKDSVLPFLGLEKAPASVQLDFSSLSVGAAPGMDPRARGDQTRKVEVAVFGGAEHTLWVAPTAAGGFCYEWTSHYGGCNTDGSATLDAAGPALLPPGVQAPTTPADASQADKIAAIEKGHALATVTPWIVGYVSGSKDVHTVQVRFSDGSTARPPITWISAPINAGFYSYDVPPGEQTSTNHVTAVDALSTDGTVIATQLFARGG